MQWKWHWLHLSCLVSRGLCLEKNLNCHCLIKMTRELNVNVIYKARLEWVKQVSWDPNMLFNRIKTWLAYLGIFSWRARWIVWSDKKASARAYTSPSDLVYHVVFLAAGIKPKPFKWMLQSFSVEPTPIDNVSSDWWCISEHSLLPDLYQSCW